MLLIVFTTFAITLLAFTALWAASVSRRDAGIVDMYWGPGFAVIAWMAWLMSGTPLLSDLLFVILLTLWAMRLGWHILARHRGEEDPRYAAMRSRRGATFGRDSLWMVFWLQAIIQWIASSPALTLLTSRADTKAFALMAPSTLLIMAAGLALFVGGFTIEVIADRAVARHTADPANRGKLLTTGLHARIRYPNYLGEIMLQWGLGLIAFGGTLNPLAFVGPALMTGLIMKVSGVPLLEEQFRKRPGYQEWAARTGALWPKW